MNRANDDEKEKNSRSFIQESGFIYNDFAHTYIYYN